MQLTFLGTGCSVGTPMIGCDCEVCRSDDPRDMRLRTSIHVVSGETHITVDTPPDFRQQVLRYGVERIDALVFTHAHADHILGLDDIRAFNSMQSSVIPAYGSASALEDIRRVFNYVDHRIESPPGVFRPRLSFHELEKSAQIGEIRVQALPIIHGGKPMLGYRFDGGNCSLGYVPDCKEMPDETIAALHGVDVMVLDALKYDEHKTHLSVKESQALLEQIEAKQSFRQASSPGDRKYSDRTLVLVLCLRFVYSQLPLY